METLIYEESMKGISINRIRRDPGFTMPVKHLHKEYEIYYLKEGERYYFINNRTYHVKSGGLVFIESSQIHQTSQAGQESHERLLLLLDEETVAPFFSVTGEFSLPAFFKEHGGVIQLEKDQSEQAEALFERIGTELRFKQTGYRQMALCALYELFAFTHRLMSGPFLPAAAAPLSTAPKHRKVDEVASYITVHYKEPVSLEELAERFFVNKCYLSRIFKEATGLTVVEYINLCRIRESQNLLKFTSMSITDIAGALGYDTITYFERVFKKHTGTSPVRFRRQFASTPSQPNAVS